MLNPRPFWTYIKSQKKDNQTIPPLKNESGHLVTEDHDKAELLTPTLSNPSHAKTSQASPFATVPGLLCLIYLCRNVEYLKEYLKETALEIAPILKCLFQKSLDSGSLLEDWRAANICSIYKKGDKSIPINYRSTSLTCIFCKLLEHITCSKLSSHLELNGITSSRQHNFRRDHSCVTQLWTVIHDWARSIDAGFQTDVFIWALRRLSTPCLMKD